MFSYRTYTCVLWSCIGILIFFLYCHILAVRYRQLNRLWDLLLQFLAQHKRTMSLMKVSKGKCGDHCHLWTNTSDMAAISHNTPQSTQGKRHFSLDFLANHMEKEVVEPSHTGQPIETQLTLFSKGACGRERHVLHRKRKTFTFANIFYSTTQTFVFVYLYFRFSFF